ncbi:N-acetylmuramoyl-L-alanine amidase [Eubacterium sp.]|uniref:N-acetylmuramoyl-L-alanine amidase n=1 Tax=Eubacterium sp. TaxID=142586 RepID=UPI002FC822E6
MALDYYKVILGRGDTGDDVLFLQRTLRLCGFMEPGDLMDGDCGDQTVAGINAAEAYFGQPVDGTCGPILWRNLYDYVLKIQQQLNSLFGKNVAEDGNIGSHGTETTDALGEVQEANGGEPDKICGPWTEELLGIRGYLRGCGDRTTGGGQASTPVAPGNVTATGNLSNISIYLCAGHGGSDPGACGCGLEEKERALRGTQILKPILESLGATVYLGRTGDYDKSLQDRTDEADALVVDLYVSWHFNGFNGDAHGTEVLYHPDSTDGPALAAAICNRIVEACGTTNRGAKAQDDHEVRESNMTAVIIEPNFIDNPGDADLIRDDAGLSVMANAIAQGIVDYCG